MTRAWRIRGRRENVEWWRDASEKVGENVDARVSENEGLEADESVCEIYYKLEWISCLVSIDEREKMEERLLSRGRSPYGPATVQWGGASFFSFYRYKPLLRVDSRGSIKKWRLSATFRPPAGLVYKMHRTPCMYETHQLQCLMPGKQLVHYSTIFIFTFIFHSRFFHIVASLSNQMSAPEIPKCSFILQHGESDDPAISRCFFLHSRTVLGLKKNHFPSWKRYFDFWYLSQFRPHFRSTFFSFDLILSIVFSYHLSLFPPLF